MKTIFLSIFLSIFHLNSLMYIADAKSMSFQFCIQSIYTAKTGIELSSNMHVILISMNSFYEWSLV